MSSTTAIPLLGNNTAPGSYLVETDASGFVQPLSNNKAAIVVVSDRGVPLPTEFTDPNLYIKMMGTPNWRTSLSNYSALRFLKGGFPVIARRAVDPSYTNAMSIVDKLYGPITVDLSENPNMSYLGGYTCGGNGTTFTPLQPINYQQAAKDVYSLSVTGTPATVTIDMTFTNNLTGAAPTVATPINLTATAPATAVTNAQIVSAIATAIQAYTTEDDWNIQNIKDSAGNSHIYIIAPTGTSITFSNLAGVTQDTGVDYLYEVMAIGPGSYANYTISHNIDSADFGQPQILQFNLSAALSTTGTYSISFVVNGVTYTGSVALSASDTTIAQQIAAIIAAFVSAYNLNVSKNYFSSNAQFTIAETGSNGATTMSVTNINNAYNTTYNGNSALAVVGLVAAPYAVTNIQLTGGTGFSVTEVATLQVPTFNFNFNVYENGSTSPVETKRCSFMPNLDHQGNQLQMDQVLNNPITGSEYVAVAINSALIPATLMEAYDLFNNMAIAGSITYSSPNGFNNLTLSTPINYLVGGNNLVAPSSNQIAAAWDDFSSTSSIPSIGFLIQGGYTDAAVGNAMVAVANSRYDCFPYLDMPTDVQDSAVSMIDFRQKILNINSSRGGIFTTDIKANDPYTGQSIYEPPSGYAALQQAITDFNVGPWQAAAGEVYGTLSNALAVRYSYNKTDRGLLNGAGINVIKNLRKGGIIIDGAKTLLNTPSLLTFIPVRRVLTYCEIIILNYLEGRTFLNITPTMLDTTAKAVRGFLKTVKQNEGIANYKVNVGSAVNGVQFQDNGQANIQVIIMPYEPDQFAVLNAVLANGLTFSEYAN